MDRFPYVKVEESGGHPGPEELAGLPLTLAQLDLLSANAARSATFDESPNTHCVGSNQILAPGLIAQLPAAYSVSSRSAAGSSSSISPSTTQPDTPISGSYYSASPGPSVVSYPTASTSVQAIATARPHLYSLSGSLRLPDREMRASIHTEHRYIDDTPYFVGGSQSKLVPFRVEVTPLARAMGDAEPQSMQSIEWHAILTDNAYTPIESCEVSIPKSKPKLVVQTVPFQRWRHAIDFSGEPVRVQVPASARLPFCYDAETRIVPLSTHVGGYMRLVIRPHFESRNNSECRVTIPGIRSVARADWGGEPKKRDGKGKRKADPTSEAPTKCQRGPASPPVEQATVFCFHMPSCRLMPVDRRAPLTVFVKQLAGTPVPALSVNASLISTDLEERRIGLVATGNSAEFCLGSPNVWTSDFRPEADVPVGTYRLSAAANGLSVQGEHTLVACSLAITSPRNLDPPIPGLTVRFQFALSKVGNLLSNVVARLYLSDGRVIDTADKIDVEFSAPGQYWAKAELVMSDGGGPIVDRVASAACLPRQCEVRLASGRRFSTSALDAGLLHLMSVPVEPPGFSSFDAAPATPNVASELVDFVLLGTEGAKLALHHDAGEAALEDDFLAPFYGPGLLGVHGTGGGGAGEAEGGGGPGSISHFFAQLTAPLLRALEAPRPSAAVRAGLRRAVRLAATRPALARALGSAALERAAAVGEAEAAAAIADLLPHDAAALGRAARAAAAARRPLALAALLVRGAPDNGARAAWPPYFDAPAPPRAPAGPPPPPPPPPPAESAEWWMQDDDGDDDEDDDGMEVEDEADGGPGGLAALPPELWQLVMAHLSPLEAGPARLVCRDFARSVDEGSAPVEAAHVEAVAQAIRAANARGIGSDGPPALRTPGGLYEFLRRVLFGPGARRGDWGRVVERARELVDDELDRERLRRLLAATPALVAAGERLWARAAGGRAFAPDPPESCAWGRLHRELYDLFCPFRFTDADFMGALAIARERIPPRPDGAPHAAFPAPDVAVSRAEFCQLWPWLFHARRTLAATAPLWGEPAPGADPPQSHPVGVGPFLTRRAAVDLLSALPPPARLPRSEFLLPHDAPQTARPVVLRLTSLQWPDAVAGSLAISLCSGGAPDQHHLVKDPVDAESVAREIDRVAQAGAGNWRGVEPCGALQPSVRAYFAFRREKAEAAALARPLEGMHLDGGPPRGEAADKPSAAQHYVVAGRPAGIPPPPGAPRVV